jgi:hypothetical protein
MPVRVVCNVVYAHLVAGLDAEGREKLDAELDAPLGGWDAVEARLWRRFDEAAAAGGGG